ncbi:efflux RND transporter periplasmic adaptor subunit [Halomonas sp. V046]|uniref:efflux RND transporter periplasmic adaptor subunit n=1 Tax=Halomonas sp. V046 TaxID=3459611 RepID=UPI004043E806
MLKRILPLVIVAIGVAAFVALKATRPAPPPVEVEEREWRVDAAMVSLSAHSPVLSLYGAVVAPDRVTLTAPLAGHIARRPVRDGQRVEAGDLLVALDDADVAPVVATAEADVQRLDAEIEAERVRFESDRQALEREQSLLANARSQLDRMRSLVQRNLASRAELDQDENEIARAQVTLVTRQGELDGYPSRVAQLQAQRASAQAALDEAQRDARRSRAEAPFDGIVTAVEVAPGDRVGEGDALLDLIPVEGLEVRARIPASVQREVIEALASAEVLTAVDDNGERYRLRALAGQGDPAGTEGIFDALDASSLLRPGSLVALALQRPAVTRSVALPYSALYGSDRVYAIDDGRLRALTIARRGDIAGPDGAPWVLVSGEALVDGQRIMTTHLPNAVDGLRVAQAETGRASPAVNESSSNAAIPNAEPSGDETSGARADGVDEAVAESARVEDAP